MIIHHNAFQRPDQLQGGHSRINCTIYIGDEIGGGGAHHEGNSLLQQHDVGARLQGRVQQRAAFIDKTSTLHIAGNRTYSPRAKHIVLRYFFEQELVEEGKITIHFVKTQDQIADLGTMHANKHRYRALIKLIREFEACNTGR